MKQFLFRLARRSVPPKLRDRLFLEFIPDTHIVLRKSDLSYSEDGMYTSHSPAFLQDPKFLRAYQLGEQTGSWRGCVIRWRAHIACWVAQQVAKLPGDFVECGVNRGGLARSIIDYIDFQNLDKRFYLIDNFTGLVPEYLTTAERDKKLLETYASYYTNNSKEEVAKIFEAFPNVQIVQGNVPDVLANVPTSSVAYLSLDMNCTMPEIKAAEFFWDRLTPGGIVLLDDYSQILHSEQQLAFDAFAKQRNLSVLALPTGQGILIKPLAPTD